MKENLDLADEQGYAVDETLKLPMFPTEQYETASKTKVVETFECIAIRTGEVLLNNEGMRLFGGHTVRVTGAQTLAAHGIEIAKIRILARHSSDAIMRYVAEAHR